MLQVSYKMQGMSFLAKGVALVIESNLDSFKFFEKEYNNE